MCCFCASQLSDDESDCHPNIDKASWFRMKHRSRVEREEKEEAEKQALEKANSTDVKRATELKAKLQAISAAGGDVEGEDPDAIAVELKGLDAAMAQRHARLEELEKNKKWNWENMCHVVGKTMHAFIHRIVDRDSCQRKYAVRLLFDNLSSLHEQCR
jgi:cell division cycle protein 37